MSTGAFLDTQSLGPGPALERRREPRLSWDCSLSKILAAGSQPVRVAGSRPQGPVGQVSRGLGARAPRAWGPARQGPGPFPHKNTLKLRFFANLLVGAWRRRGCRLKRLLRRWGPGGKRSRDTPPTPPPPPPTPHAPQGRRIYFGPNNLNNLNRLDLNYLNYLIPAKII